MNNVEVYKITNDEWYPSFKLDDGIMLVRVSFLELPTFNNEIKLWRVCAWGNDDCGVEKDFESETEAWVCFLEIIGLQAVNSDALFSRGFVSA